MKHKGSCVTFLLAVCLFLTFCAGQSAAQTTTVAIVGSIRDNTGGVLVGAQVTIVNLGTNATRSMAANESGDYAFTLLPVGNYSVTVEAAGFKRFSAPKVVLSAGDTGRVDANMTVGDVKETVEVAAESAGAIQTDSSTVGGLVTTQAVQDLPVNGRDIMKLVVLVPGANEGVAGAISSGVKPDDRRMTSSISANGQGDMSNNYMIDGIDNNERIIGTIGVKPSIDAVQEVKVQTSLFTADVGRVAGAVVNMITKSGTNTFHGTAFEFLRNAITDAKDFFNVPQAGNPLAGVRPPYHQNQFGASLGGPIKKNKLFFFGDYEGLRIVQGQTGSATIPTPCELGRANCNGVTQLGNFSDLSTVIYDPMSAKPTPFPNNLIPVSRINAVAQNYAALFPTAPAASCTTSCLFVNSPVRTQSADQFDLRGDMPLKTTDFLFVRYSFNNTNTYTPGLLPEVSVAGVAVQPGGVPTNVSFPGPSHQRFHNAAIGYTKIFSSSVVLQLNGGFMRGLSASLPLNTGVNVSSAFGQPGVNVSPQTAGLAPLTFNDGGYVTMGDAAWLPLYDWDNTFDYMGSVTWTKGAHTLKFGASLIRRQADNYQSQYGKGNFSVSSSLTNSTEGASGGSGGNSLASALLGYPVSIQRSLSLVTQNYRMWEVGSYAQDDWRVKPWLTLNLGVRWDLFTPFTDAHNDLSNFDPTNSATLASSTVQMAGQNGVSATAGIHTEWRDFQPRLGFAITLPHNMVVRGGFSTTYSPNNGGSQGSLKNEPFVNIFIQNASLGNPGASLPTLGTALPAATGTSTCLSTACGATGITSLTSEVLGLQNGLVYEANLTVQKEFAGNVLTAAYVGEWGRHLGRELPNADLPLPPAMPGGCGQTTAITLPGPCQPYYSSIPLVSYIQLMTSTGVNNYNALQLSFTRRLKHGLLLGANYTFSHDLSNAAENAGRGACGTCGLLLNDPAYDYGNSDTDMKNRIAITGNYELPFGKSLKGVSGQVVKGWQMNAIYLFGSGLPFNVINSSNPQSNIGTGVGGTAVNITGDRPNVLATPSSFQPSISQWIDTTAFALQPYGTPGNEGRNVFYGPPQRKVDFSLFKDFSLKESVTLQFRVEVFNLTNTPSFAQPGSSGLTSISGWTSANAATAVPTQAGNFGRIIATSQWYTPRDVQFALKLVF